MNRELEYDHDGKAWQDLILIIKHSLGGLQPEPYEPPNMPEDVILDHNPPPSPELKGPVSPTKKKKKKKKKKKRRQFQMRDIRPNVPAYQGPDMSTFYPGMQIQEVCRMLLTHTSTRQHNTWNRTHLDCPTFESYTLYISCPRTIVGQGRVGVVFFLHKHKDTHSRPSRTRNRGRAGSQRPPACAG